MTAATDLRTGEFISAGGISTHYHDVGAGEPVVLLHGSGPGVSAWANWQHTMPALARSARVLALDLVGYGATERPQDVRYSLRTWTDHVWAFLDAVGVDQVAVVGNSLGGRIALRLAADDSSRLRRGTPAATWASPRSRCAPSGCPRCSCTASKTRWCRPRSPGPW
ncbi:MAG: alpha/beta fold hydrolase [Streptosporangiaceae bacterium]